MEKTMRKKLLLMLVAIAIFLAAGSPRQPVHSAYREENGDKILELTTKVVQWPILDGVSVTAYTYNGTVPGPMIRVTEGDQVRIIVKNELDDPTTVHWHGVEGPNNMDV